MTFVLSSTAFEKGGTIARRNTVEGLDLSPELTWKNAPEGSKSFALTCVDPDAPAGDWVHWVAWNIQGSRLPEGILHEDSRLNQGLNSWPKYGYGGPMPPQRHGSHRYYFTLYALNVDRLDLDKMTDHHKLMDALKGHILDKIVLMGTYERS